MRSRLFVALSLFATSATAASYTGSGPIDPQRLSADVKVLASDAFEGRAPGTAGEDKAVAYIVDRFKQLGLQPAGDNGGWTQAVPLVRTQVGAGPSFNLQTPRGAIAWTQAQQIYVNTVRPKDRVSIDDAPVVFVGYGVKAAERGWDDFKGYDLHGKVAVFLVNDPDFEAKAGEPAAGRFGGNAMTYYGRWTYKYEEAARQGAVAALIVHDTPGAGYGWTTVIAPRGETFDVVRADGGAGRVPLQGWIEGRAAADLFSRAGLDLAALRVQARSPAFRPVELKGVRFTADVPVTHTVVQSRNVLAKIAGARRPDESVMYAAHWDAYGLADKPDAAGGRIRAGAADDAIGVAALFEIARALKAGPPPARTVVFGAWTAEERGLLGSEFYASHPTIDLAKTAGAYTVDVLQTAGPAHDVVLIGKGQNQLETGLARAAAGQGRVVIPDAHAEKGLFYRADHFSFAKRGVPVLLMMGIGGAPDLVEGGRAAGERWVNDYTARCYHQSCDSWSADWDLRGAAQDVDLIFEAGRDLANSRDWPEWNAGSEFKPVRDQTASVRR